MFRSAILATLALWLSACQDRILLYDLLDAAAGTDAASAADSGWPSCTSTARTTAWAARTPPELLILLDRSLEMQKTFSNSTTTRLGAVQDALSSAVQRYGKELIQFGFGQFPADANDNDFKKCQVGECCAGSIIAPKLDNEVNVLPRLQCPITPGQSAPSCAPQVSSSPSHIALDKARDYYSDHSWGSPYILLVVSGDPSCMPGEESSECGEAYYSVAKLTTNDVRTAFMVVGSQPSPSSCLSKSLGQYDLSMPLITGGKNPFWATTPESVVSSLSPLLMALGRKTACTQYLNLYPADWSTAELTLDGQKIQRHDNTNPDGWGFTNKTTIQLYGADCDRSVANGKVPLLELAWPCSICGPPNSCPYFP